MYLFESLKPFSVESVFITENRGLDVDDMLKTVVFQVSTAQIDCEIAASPDITIGSWVILRAEGSSDYDVRVWRNVGDGVVFRTVFGNADFKIDGRDGYSVYMEKTGEDEWLIQGNIKA